MTTERPTPPIQATVQPNTIRLFAALELSRSKWLVTVSAPGSDKLSKYVVAGGDGDALLDLVARLRAEAERRAGQPVHVLVIQEAGLDGFRIHRLLEQNGIESQVVDPASIAVDRRHRRAKTDAIDGEMLLRTLMAWRRGERRVCSMVKPPSPEEEDRRRLTRERGTLLKERTQHTNRIKGLLAGQGITDYDPLRQDRPALRSPAPGSSGPSRGAQDRRRAALARAAQSGDPSRDRADRPGLRPDRRSRA
jgi:transposase